MCVCVCLYSDLYRASARCKNNGTVGFRTVGIFDDLQTLGFHKGSINCFCVFVSVVY